MKYKLLVGDSLTELSRIEDKSVQCIVTSPPYYQMRDYGVDNQLGQEDTPEEYIQKLVDIFKECRRVLRDDGICWINIGDTYNNNNGFSRSSEKYQRKGRANGTDHKKAIKHNRIKYKDLMGLPWMLAFALQEDGWYLREDIIYSKTNPMPDGAKDRPCRSHEYVFMFTKKAKYYYDYFNIMEFCQNNITNKTRFGARNAEGTYRNDTEREVSQANKKQKRSVWTLPVSSYKGHHFATYPQELIEPCIKSSIPDKGCCSKCKAPYERIVEKVQVPHDCKEGYVVQLRGDKWIAQCDCKQEITKSYVLDPFMGSGTTALVSLKNNANFIGIEINPKYLEIARNRIRKFEPIFAEELE